MRWLAGWLAGWLTGWLAGCVGRVPVWGVWEGWVDGRTDGRKRAYLAIVM